MTQINITNQPNQRFTSRIPLIGRNITFSLFAVFNTVGGFWQLDISDANGNLLLKALPLVATYPVDLLSPYSYLNIGSLYVLPLSSNAPDYPGANDWGSNFTLLWE
jgi:hypothetical protein